MSAVSTARESRFDSSEAIMTQTSTSVRLVHGIRTAPSYWLDVQYSVMFLAVHACKCT